MKEKTKAYMAGLWDAEGSFGVYKTTPSTTGYLMYQYRVVLTNTYRPVIKWAMQHFGGTFKVEKHKQNPHWKLTYRWSPQGAKHSIWFIEQILPYLVEKRAQAQLLLDYLKMDGRCDPEFRDSLLVRCQQLKQSPVTTDSPSFPKKQNLLNAYLAGFMDGEGTIRIRKVLRGTNLVLSATNTYRPAIDQIQEQFGGRVYARFRDNSTKPGYTWELYDRQLQERFLLSTLPYLQIKGGQARLALDWARCAGNPSLRENLRVRVQALNGKKIQSGLTSDRESGPKEI